MLKLIDLTVGYGDLQATHGISLEIDKGAIFALIGANGAGKSSTLMGIAGHTRTISGSIVFDGEDITSLPAHQRVKRGIAVSPEGRRLFPDLTVSENLTVGGYSRPPEEDPENRDIVFDLFPRLSERLHQRAGTLSGGEQQMLAIGRALMAKPKMLMVDEISLGLMPKAVDICYEAIARLKQRGITVIFVEQSTSRALKAADRVCVLESGNIVWQGSADEARDDPAMIEAFMGIREG